MDKVVVEQSSHCQRWLWRLIVYRHARREGKLYFIQVVEFADTKIGLIHGHQIIPWADEEALYNKAKKMGVNLLISGHTHDLKVSEHSGVTFINPGSTTGAYSSLKLNAVPAFMILEFKSN